MTVYCLGSINVDHVYRVAHLPGPGETLAAEGLSRMLGGKGANQSVAAARAGARVVHVGAVGPDGGFALTALQEHGVDCTHVRQVETPTGHAVILVDAAGENAITLFPGANHAQSAEALTEALDGAGPGDTLLLQNETDLQVEAAQVAHARGLRVIYSAAPFAVDAVRAILPHVSLLAMNAVEADQLRVALGGVTGCDRLVTRGAQGAQWFMDQGETVTVPAFPVSPVDSTGAGDCLIGWAAAVLDRGADRGEALREASAAAALQVARPGTAQAIPSRDEVAAFIAAQ